MISRRNLLTVAARLELQEKLLSELVDRSMIVLIDRLLIDLIDDVVENRGKL
jgi:hypothetical protein